MTPHWDRIEHLLQQGVQQKVYPGAVWAIGDADGIRTTGSCGLLDPRNADHPMTRDTVSDIASLTKIVAVWSIIGTLWDQERLNLDDPLGALIPDLDGYQMAHVTVRHLLTHTAGVPLRANLRNLYGTDPSRIRTGVLREPLHRPPGQAVEYTDRAALILGFVAEHLTHMPLDQLARTHIWQPLGMTITSFGPLTAKLVDRCAPTEYDEKTGRHLKGTAHDFSARLLGGACGIAGAFSTMADLATFQRHLLEPGIGTAFSAAWVQESLQVHTGDLQPARGLFWHPAPGTDPVDDIHVHYGFTGTGMWISPKQGRWAVLLTNKLYYGRDRQPLAEIRNRFRVLVFA
ncbi:serine hydrolase domain-containing protein [Nonomuraea basaltis]|uniref:serine hydrolase domain-containing protein n=1 Tax=Nonomuraea basaltis TaxID=2495887 RepID=UPI00110C61F1|nr:serine hydrolase domain-containing protein [Nonomuraea basaltis]TMR98392.1 beta-lactamase family protein [Nonomuraea basaltis]